MPLLHQQKSHWNPKEQAQQPEGMWLSPGAGQNLSGGVGEHGAASMCRITLFTPRHPGHLLENLEFDVWADPMTPGHWGLQELDTIGSRSPPILQFSLFSEGQ